MPVVVPGDSREADVTVPQQSRYINLVTYTPVSIPQLSPPPHGVASCGCYFFQPAELKKYPLKSLYFLSPQTVCLHVSEGRKTLACCSLVFLGSCRPLAGLEEILLLWHCDYKLHKAAHCKC